MRDRTISALAAGLGAGGNLERRRRSVGSGGIAAALADVLQDVQKQYDDLEVLEQRLSAPEDKMVSSARTRQTEEELFQVRRELDAQLRPYRGKMTAEQLAMLEKQYLDRGVMESAGLPRLSLFYMR